MNTELGKSSDNVISCSKPTSVHSVNHVDRGVSILYGSMGKNGTSIISYVRFPAEFKDQLGAI